jgi:hypothetical protein
MSVRKSCKFSVGEDGLGIYDIFTNLPCDVGMEGLLIGANQRIIASSF